MRRLFAAVLPDRPAVDHLDAFLEPRRAAGDFRWSRPEQFHVTLAFMGAVAEARVDDYVDRLADSLDDVAPAGLRLAGALVFPNVSEGRVLAAGVEGDLGVLEKLARRARSAAVRSGIEVDGQPFRPHLTLARTGGRAVELSSWARLMDEYAGPSWPLDAVEIISSHLGEGPRRSPRYETLARIEL